jgi:glycosyltransferase involved in cell wall biosynthesis
LNVNICLISTGFPPDNGGGIGTYIYNLSHGLVKLGHSVHVIYPAKQSAYSHDIVDEINVHRLPKKILPKIEGYFPGVRWSYQVYKLIKKLHQRQCFDVIEFPNWEAPGVISQFFLNIPSVVRVHTPFFETLGLDSDTILFGDKTVCHLEKYSCKKANQLISSTKCHAKTIVTEYQMAIDKVHILPLGVIDKNPHSTIKSNQDNIWKVLYVSRLENRKGTLAFLQSLTLIHNKYKNIQIDIIGSDRTHAPGERKFEQYFNETYPELVNVVTFHGFVEDHEIEKFYTNADIFVVPSVYESFGLIYVEAMMYGLPSIATIGGGIPEVISDGHDGLLTQINDSKDIAEKVLTLFDNPELMKVMRLRARKSFQDKFEYLIMAKNTEHIYQKVALTNK